MGREAKYWFIGLTSYTICDIQKANMHTCVYSQRLGLC